ncbi:hypothetical protein FA95DRAFT_1551310 [Auriscalpium vulgare]|uniref:Uncharacterized protein n=1 Tax=Auriscalpium vulgare TaxID=40419 RepID=A0ACB8R2H4_9AGAM|nr:hypothetical protein FA95DRAFT_1551310 [Auriscalpium vulgare]
MDSTEEALDIFTEEDEDLFEQLYGEQYESDQFSDDEQPETPLPPPPAPPPPPIYPVDPIQLKRTQQLRDNFTGNVAEVARDILNYIDSKGMNLPFLLDAVSWGDAGCIEDSKIRYERTGLMVSKELPGIIARWCRPPRTSGSHDARAGAASAPMQKFAIEHLGNVIDQELERAQDLLRSPPDSLSEKSLAEFSLEKKIESLRSADGVPTLWSVLTRVLGHRSADSGVKSRKDPEKIAFMLVSQIAFTRNQHLNHWPKLLTVYLKGIGLPAKGLDLLHAAGVTMSHRWSVRAFEVISEEAMREARQIVQNLPFVFSHDNINIAFTAFEQRENNKTHFDSGTAGTLFSKLKAPSGEPAISNADFQAARKAGSKTPITAEELLELQEKGGERYHKAEVHHVLEVLLDAPAFNRAEYPGRNDPLLQPPSPVHQLPHGPEHVVHENVMRTVHQEEASYEGNEKLIIEWLGQLGLASEEERKRTGNERLFIWIGDQLTVERLRGLIRYRSLDHNSFDRLDWIVPVFGWFHLQIAFANSLHKQFLGTVSGKGLLHAMTNLERKGLAYVQTKGPFYHHLDELIIHCAKARFRAAWKTVSKADDLSELRSKSPAELVALAEKVVRDYASNHALENMMLWGDKDRDDVLSNSIIWNRDVLRYIELRHGIKFGDTGSMEDTLPYLLCRFAGGGNHKYANEVLELLQSLHHEWPKELSTFVRERAWLVNMKGHRDSFLPVDMAQEHNVKDVKVTYRSQGPNAGWDLLYKRGPAIPRVRFIRQHFETLFPSLRRGVSHTSPQSEADVDKLEQIYTEAKIHAFTKRRKTSDKDRAVDTTTKGWNYVNTKLMPRWQERREYPRATTDMWSLEQWCEAMRGSVHGSDSGDRDVPTQEATGSPTSEIDAMEVDSGGW